MMSMKWREWNKKTTNERTKKKVEKKQRREQTPSGDLYIWQNSGHKEN